MSYNISKCIMICAAFLLSACGGNRKESIVIIIDDKSPLAVMSGNNEKSFGARLVSKGNRHEARVSVNDDPEILVVYDDGENKVSIDLKRPISIEIRHKDETIIPENHYVSGVYSVDLESGKVTNNSE